MSESIAKWLPLTAGAIMLLTNFLKSPAAGQILKRIPPRWRIAIPVILGGVAGILHNIVAGGDVAESIYIGLFSGPGAVFLHEAVVEAIMGKSESRRDVLSTVWKKHAEWDGKSPHPYGCDEEEDDDEIA